ncbi:hypothetical protein HDU89_005764 [Geranomyces variabilis]|nr:hypothetical protein HDU89_005764 [Geranomyces variabilis]
MADSMFVGDDSSYSETERKLENEHFNSVVRAFKNYRLHALTALAKRRRDLASVSGENHALLDATLRPKIDATEQCVLQNAAVISALTEGHGADDVANGVGKAHAVSEADMDKVKSTLRQFARDWSEEGRNERHSTYEPIIAELEARFAHLAVEDRGRVKVLVPGAGLGRLAFDIVKRGFSCQGNEFSMFMLLGSHFILNRSKHPKQFTIYPWIHSFSNHLNVESQLCPIQIPDVAISDIAGSAEFSMVAGDFLEVYGSQEHEGAWDAIVTCFFIDTAKNPLDYIDTMRKALKPGGVWINMGPLLYHWEGMERETSIELTLEELKSIVVTKGFVLENERMVRTTYASNLAGMLKYVYDCAFFCAVKT